MPVDADEALRRATLVRSDPSLRGVSRENIADTEGEVLWRYFMPDGEPVEEDELIERWNSMGLPPAWENVWICPNPRGHIQATGRDVKGRLQYRYHPDWTEITTEMKYDDVVYFASQLPRLRRQVARDIDQGDVQSLLWWRATKEVTRHHAPGVFHPFYAYERSQDDTDHNVISYF